jgi:hypothetical protein
MEYGTFLRGRILLNPRHSVPVVKPTRCTSFSNYLFLYNTLHVSDSLSYHHQEFRTVRAATVICQTETATCLLAGTRWNWVSCVVRGVFTIGIYYDARTYERQITRHSVQLISLYMSVPCPLQSCLYDLYSILYLLPLLFLPVSGRLMPVLIP